MLPDRPRSKDFWPGNSVEFAEAERWRLATREGGIVPVDTAACWSDICGVGKALKAAQWDLRKLEHNGVFQALGDAHTILGNPFVVGIPPMPSERVLVLNDGVARTIDLHDGYPHQSGVFAWYLRDLVMHHFLLEASLVGQGLGLRTILAGGQRCQYSPSRTTGESVLYYTDEPSEHGKKILDQQFVFNPHEFQMNTAFARAFTLDAMGSAASIVPNGFYIDRSWLDAIALHAPGFANKKGALIEIQSNGLTALIIELENELEVEVKGITSTVYDVRSLTVTHAWEEEQTAFPMTRHRRKHT